ncbi:ABC transporter permease protein [Luminiphilus syltensis NOR5-1B]|uniref:ABC transporter permease protein n=1 Tax=Luminiphilus syltensis NOR5-1B TaxID=565045 RepID=B8KVH7_9GAMM|nr:ABC transporter permease [Luminiphilus syltensis]EED36712.1 ABC transporter permease protein [Luminiphilus syltensis NOR5-1B]
MTADSDADTPQWELVGDDDCHHSLILKGSWESSAVLPELGALFQPDDTVTALRVDALEVARWDSRLISLLLKLHRYCESRGISITTELPEGASQLLALAVAVPPAVESPSQSAGWLHSLNPLPYLERLGARVTDFLNFVGSLVSSTGRVVTGRGRVRVSDLLAFAYQTGPNALPIIGLTSLLVGMILGYLGAVQLQQFGAGIFVADLVTIGVLREMGALMTAIIIAGRTGAAYAAQLGTMRVNEEVDAIEILGISLMDFLVLPRVLAVTLMVPLLSLYAAIMGIVGGGIVSISLGITPLQYWTQAQTSLGLDHLLVGLSKALLFGALIGIAGCRAGMQSGRSSEGVGKATTTAVVVALVYLILADAAVNLLCQLLGI